MREVSRKTPLDGKLEISADASARLRTLGEELPLMTAGRTGTARLQSFTCTCAKAAAGAHVHYFLESELLRTLAAGTRVGVDLDDAGRMVRVEPL